GVAASGATVVDAGDGAAGEVGSGEPDGPDAVSPELNTPLAATAPTTRPASRNSPTIPAGAAADEVQSGPLRGRPATGAQSSSDAAPDAPAAVRLGSSDAPRATSTSGPVGMMTGRPSSRSTTSASNCSSMRSPTTTTRSARTPLYSWAASTTMASDSRTSTSAAASLSVDTRWISPTIAPSEPTMPQL